MRIVADLLAVALALVAPSCAIRADESALRIETVLITGATFTMGSPIRHDWSPKYHDDEALLEVTVDDFRIGKYPVTAEQMCIFLNSASAKEHDRETLYNHRDLDDKYAYSTIILAEDGQYVPREDAGKAPANQVTWKGAVLFCQWLSADTDKRYRLPTEAEWELAARGKELRRWPWGNTGPTKKHGPRYDPNELLNSLDLHRRKKKNQPTWPTAPVGSHPANATPDGVHDMLTYLIGEWCTNKYVAHPTADEATNQEMDLNDLTSYRVVRGYYHRWHSRTIPFLTDQAKHAGRPWTRVYVHPIDAVKNASRHGFRVVEEVKPQ
jgi:formylglycine-generating enzyme required for sulfatase activity